MTERWTLLMEAVGEQKTAWWAVLLRLLVLFVLLSAASFGLLSMLGFPTSVAILFAVVVGIQGSGLAWVTAGIRARVREGIVESRFESHKLRYRALLILAAFAVGFVLYVIFSPKGIWLQTISIVTLTLSGLFGAFSLLASYLLEWEGSTLSHGFAGRWLGRLTALLVFGTGVVLLLMTNFLGGIHWWYGRYVTTEQRTKVLARNRFLRAVQLTALFDRHNKYIGLYKKTESDWDRHYNDPSLLQWPVSRVIALAEGAVEKPAWWWRYLPDGERLQCEPFSIEAFLRVPYYFIKQRRKVGGSTPALQAAKNYFDFGGGRRHKGFLTTVRTKLFAEMPRSYIMCQAFSPREMMAIYQATLWAGQGANYGVHRMALHFFGVDDPPALDWNQASVIVASLPNPGRLNPWYVKSCRLGKCKNKRRKAVYKVWRKRISQIKARLRAKGIKVPKELPAFHDGLSRLQAISYKWMNHDLHIRSWIQQVVQQSAPEVKDWDAGARIRLYYDRKMTTGTPKEQGLASIAQEFVTPLRDQIEGLQISYVLLNSQNGRIASQYGGNGSVDMALARKPVVGSTFKVMTLMVADQWPDALPFLNKGRSQANRRKFIYHPTPRHPSHWVRNSHKMPPYVDKTQALAISANIGFVFFSLRWTWMASPLKWLNIFSLGLQQMFIEKKKMSEDAAKQAIEALLKDPVQLRRALVKDFGYQPYFQMMREHATFEAAKSATIKRLLADAEVDKKQLAELLSMEPNELMDSLGPKIVDTFKQERENVAKRFQGPLSLEEISWNRELRMEIGLRYIIYLATRIAGYDAKKSHLVPVMTMTLGVNDADTRQLASVSSYVVSGRVRPAVLLHTIVRGKTLHYQRHLSAQTEPPPVATAALEQVRKAMSEVLRSGTAKGAGNWLKKTYGEAILAQAGAKTGTVQGSRGVSCIGFLGHRVGAVTLSTPRNEVLKAYRVKRTLTNKLALYKRREEYWTKRRKSARSSRWKRKAQAQMERYQQLRQQWQAKAERVKDLGKRYWHLRKQKKALDDRAKAAMLLARKSGQRAGREQRRALRSQRYAERQQQVIDRAKQRIEDLGGVKDMSVREKRRYRAAQKTIAKASQRKEKWVTKQRDSLAKEQKYRNRQAQATRSATQYRTQAQDIQSQYSGMSREFFATHQRWSLSSSSACRVLFSLLGRWKDWEEKIQPPPTEDALEPKDIESKSTDADTLPLPNQPDAGVSLISMFRRQPPPPDGALTPERRYTPDAGAGAPAGTIEMPDASGSPEARDLPLPDVRIRRFTPDARMTDARSKKVLLPNSGLDPVLRALGGGPTGARKPIPRTTPRTLPPPPVIVGEPDKREP